MNILKLLLSSLALLLLMNCGGGGDEKNTEEVPESQTNEASLQSNDEKTTLLKDNPISTTTSVKVFDNYSLKVSMSEVNMEGDFRFLKIMDKQKNTLFLGQIDHRDNIKLPLNIVTESFPLTVEIFSELKVDETISYEVIYE
ncbi:MAG: hypothetical protein ACI88H_003299 [Cocleimonas sp.]|jgi:hypothetical protein